MLSCPERAACLGFVYMRLLAYFCNEGGEFSSRKCFYFCYVFLE